MGAFPSIIKPVFVINVNHNYANHQSAVSGLFNCGACLCVDCLSAARAARRWSGLKGYPAVVVLLCSVYREEGQACDKEPRGGRYRPVRWYAASAKGRRADGSIATFQMDDSPAAERSCCLIRGRWKPLRAKSRDRSGMFTPARPLNAGSAVSYVIISVN